MGKPQFNHYSPVFTNAPWAEDNHYVCWKRRYDVSAIAKEESGRRQWGRQRKLYSKSVELALDRELETPIAQVYRKLANYEEPAEGERIKWAQFLRSQIVRTPLFMRYEQAARDCLGIEEEPLHDRVGCEQCSDLADITGRRWLLLRAHEDEYFVRTDSPVFHTGFLNDPATVLCYPLTPRLCFVATDMKPDWDPLTASQTPIAMGGVPLEKGAAHMLNFYFAKSADESLILRPSDSGIIDQQMFTDVMGIYPQPPFDLHRPQTDELFEAKESIRKLMSAVDGQEYSEFNAQEVSGFGQCTS